MGKANAKFRALNSAELAYFFEQMTMFAKSGMPTWESLLIISENTPKKEDASLFRALYDIVSAGNSFSYALTEVGCFPEYVISMVEVSEQTGRIEEVATALAKFYSDKDKLRTQIRSSIVYPLFMAGMVFVVIFVILVEVMPVFEQVFNQLGIAMNPISMFMLNLGSDLSSYTVVILGVIAAVVVLFVLMRLIRKGREVLRSIYDNAPVTRGLSKAESANRFAFSLSLMLGSGLDTLSALELTMLLVDSPQTKQKINIILKNMERGESLCDAIIASEVFSATHNGIIVAGMRSGAVSDMLMDVSERYSIEAKRQTDRLISIIEPTMVALLCVMVGLVMLSVMLPLTGILSGI